MVQAGFSAGFGGRFGELRVPTLFLTQRNRVGKVLFKDLREQARVLSEDDASS